MEHLHPGAEFDDLAHQCADDAVARAHDQVAGRATDVDAVVGVGGVPEDPVVLLVEGVHRPPRERDLPGEEPRVRGERDVLPRPAGGVTRAAGDLEPRGLAELGVLCAVAGEPERAVGEVLEREVRHGVAARVEQQHRVVALDDGAPVEDRAKPAPQQLGVEDALVRASIERG